MARSLLPPFYDPRRRPLPPAFAPLACLPAGLRASIEVLAALTEDNPADVVADAVMLWLDAAEGDVMDETELGFADSTAAIASAAVAKPEAAGTPDGERGRPAAPPQASPGEREGTS